MVTTTRPTDSQDDRTLSVVGTRPVRPDGVDKVTGRAQYGADVQPAGLIHGRILRSPHAHARIRSIDTSKAKKLAGVRAIITAADFPTSGDGIADLGESVTNLRDLAGNMMAHEKALYRGHAVAAVAATTPRIAEEAANLIVVDYEVLPPVLEVRAAMADDAPILLDHLRTKSQAGMGDTPTNVASYTRTQAGDVAAGFAEADHIVEREYTTTMVHQGYIEPQSSTALWTADGNLTIWTSTQGAFSIRQQVADVLQHPISKVKVVPTEIGGGFGGKIPSYTDAVAALLAKQAGVPVKVTMSRADVFEGTGPTSGTYIRVKIGAKNDGTITAMEAYLAYEAGAYPGSSVMFGGIAMTAPYVIPNVAIDAYDVVVNKPKVAAYRAPGAPQGMYASESAIDELAQKIGMDPIEFRLKNASAQGTRLPNGMPFAFPIGNQQVMEAAKHSAHYTSPMPVSEGTKRRGRGIAMGFWPGAPLKSSCFANVFPDGTVSLIEGNPDIGGSRASLAMQLAETLGLPYEAIKPQVVDTDSVGYNDVTGGSRTTFATGLAVHEVGLDIIRQIKERAIEAWKLQPEDAEKVEYRDGVVSGPNEDQRFTFKEMAQRAMKGGTPLVGRATVSPKTVGMSFGCHIADVEVDAETGKVQVLRYTAIQDAGKAVHPSYVEGQMQGGVAQGIGWALNEEYAYDDNGRLLNANFLDYRMPTALDLPMIDTIIVEVPHPGHPYGVRGVGETPIVPPLATMANAVSRALEHRFTALPISPRRIVDETITREPGA